MLRRTVKKFWAILGLLSIEVLIIFVLFIAALLAFAFIAYNVFGLDKVDFDRQVFQFLRPYITATNTQVMYFITFFATHTFLLPANLILASYFIFKRHRWYSIKIPVVALSSYLLMALLKLYFSRPRPDDPVYQAAAGFSFPSGHAMSAMTFYGLLIYLTWHNLESKAARWLLSLLLVCIIFLIGFSRVYLRVHYASDVLAGFCLGLVWLVASLWIMRRIENYTRREIAPVVEDNSQQA